MYTRLNHLNVTLSYSGTLQAVTEVSSLHKVPLQQWIAEGVPFKFVGNNVDKTKRVRDIRSDHRAELQHMYSLLVVQICVPSPHGGSSLVCDIASLPPSAFLPKQQDVVAIQDNLVILVTRILFKHMKPLSFLSKDVVAHIDHQYSKEMGKKSDVVVLDVLMKNETKVLKC